MVDIVNYKFTSVTTETTASNSWVQATNYDITWENLTAAGFANGDDVIVIRRVTVTGNSGSAEFGAQFRYGSTYAGATQEVNNRIEPQDAGTPPKDGKEMIYIDRLTLSTDDDFYVGKRSYNGSSTATLCDYSFIMLKLDDLVENTDFFYAVDTISGNAPTTNTDGASITLPSGGGGKWGIIADIHWLMDTAGTDYEVFSHLNLGGTLQMDNVILSADDVNNNEVYQYGMFGYIASAGASDVCKVVYRNDTTGPGDADYTRSAIFAISLDAFVNGDGEYDTTNVNMTGNGPANAIEVHDLPFTLDSTGDVAYFSQSMANIVSVGQDHNPFHQIKIDGTEIVATLGQYANAPHDNTNNMLTTGFGITNVSAGTPEFQHFGGTYSGYLTTFGFNKHTTFAFSLKLAGAGWDQDQFRFGADDNNEATHGWLAAQNANITEPASTQALLRIQATSSGDQPAVQMKLQTKLSTDADTEYKDVPIA